MVALDLDGTRRRQRVEDAAKELIEGGTSTAPPRRHAVKYDLDVCQAALETVTAELIAALGPDRRRIDASRLRVGEVDAN